nr:hypothetical protein [Brevundimonas sp.]
MIHSSKPCRKGDESFLPLPICQEPASQSTHGPDVGLGADRNVRIWRVTDAPKQERAERFAPKPHSRNRTAGRCWDRSQRTGGRYALITLCIGGGQGIAMVIERAYTSHAGDACASALGQFPLRYEHKERSLSPKPIAV